ncbi:hypothetical protein [Haloglycomyces albus]|uniref:hypothetical protein n=1 Tax=Haloglycomyces albus TaxID=526067 RepID=UPI00046CF6CD|nr:hypothetical protein [Haloglycomyces albus]
MITKLKRAGGAVAVTLGALSAVMFAAPAQAGDTDWSSETGIVQPAGDTDWSSGGVGATGDTDWSSGGTGTTGDTDWS